MTVEISADSKSLACELLLEPDQAFKLKLKPIGFCKEFVSKAGVDWLECVGAVECFLDWKDGSYAHAILEGYVVRSAWEAYTQSQSPHRHQWTTLSFSSSTTQTSSSVCVGGASVSSSSSNVQTPPSQRSPGRQFRASPCRGHETHAALLGYGALLKLGLNRLQIDDSA